MIGRRSAHWENIDANTLKERMVRHGLKSKNEWYILFHAMNFAVLSSLCQFAESRFSGICGGSFETLNGACSPLVQPHRINASIVSISISHSSSSQCAAADVKSSASALVFH